MKTSAWPNPNNFGKSVLRCLITDRKVRCWMNPITNLMTRDFIYCLSSREMVFEKICMRDLASTAMILHTAKSLLVHKLRN